MTDKSAGAPRQPRIETCGAWLAAGLRRRYRYDDLWGLPGQWQELAPYLGKISGRLGSAAYGVMLPVAEFDDGFDYLAGVLLDGSGLKPSSEGWRVYYDGEKKTVTDGPFTETKEQLGGYHLVECADRDEALAIAQRIPTLPAGGTVEVRPLLYRLGGGG